MRRSDFWKDGDVAEAQIPLDISNKLADAIWTWLMFGVVDEIAEFIRSKWFDGWQADREWLADFLSGKIKPPPRKPPFQYLLQRSHETSALEMAHDEVRRLISEWTAGGQKRRGQKKDAIDAAVDKFCPDGTIREDFLPKLVNIVERSIRSFTQLPEHAEILLGTRVLSNGNLEHLDSNGDIHVLGRGVLFYRTAYLLDRGHLPRRPIFLFPAPPPELRLRALSLVRR